MLSAPVTKDVDMLMALMGPGPGPGFLARGGPEYMHLAQGFSLRGVHSGVSRGAPREQRKLGCLRQAVGSLAVSAPPAVLPFPHIVHVQGFAFVQLEDLA